MIERIREAVDFLQNSGIGQPEAGIILGTGLGSDFVNQIESRVTIDYSKIPYFPLSTVEGHKGRLIYGVVKGRKVLCMQGRFHYYEGYSMQDITFPVRVMKMLGIRFLLISNAAGNLNRSWKKGELMLLKDHINLLPENPLRGKNADELGPRFPDMSEPYHRMLNQNIRKIAAEMKIEIREGVYAAVMGPNLETAAEYRFLRIIGADVVGMSTVPEVIVAKHMSLPCSAVSVLTDDCDPDKLEPVEIQDILEVAAKVEPVLSSLFVNVIASLPSPHP